MNKEQYKLYFSNIIVDALAFIDGTPFKLNAHHKKKALKVLKVKQASRGTSWGGEDCITIETNCWQLKNIKAGKTLSQFEKFKTAEYKRDGYTYMCEYRSYDNDPKCGGMFVKNGDIHHGLLVAVLHELAHFIQHNLCWKKFPHMSKAHGDGFKQIYTRLREQFCNDDIVRNIYIDKWKII